MTRLKERVPYLKVQGKLFELTPNEALFVMENHPKLKIVTKVSRTSAVSFGQRESFLLAFLFNTLDPRET